MTTKAAPASTDRRLGLLSTYPPTICGLATFAASLGAAMSRSGSRVDIVRVRSRDEAPASSRSVSAELVEGSPGSLLDAVGVLSGCDVAIVAHEYGIYGGVDGAEVLEVLQALDVPTIVILHTVLAQPTPHQRSVLMAVVALADRVVVMADSARSRLIADYSVDPGKVVTIPHGASVVDLPRRRNERRASRRTNLLTWGLLGPGKGIEHMIDAMSMLSDCRGSVDYTVAGVTHPKVLATSGNRYRNSLMRRAEVLNVTGSVSFDDTYRDLAQLTRFVATADLVVLPYDSRDQATSGVLVDAIAAGTPVIATAFPHAVELLGSGAGILVPHEDPFALAQAIRAVVTDRRLLSTMTAEARRLAPSLSWSGVARRYVGLADQLLQAAEPVPT